MLKLEAGEGDYLANSWGRVAKTVALGRVLAVEKSLHECWVLLIEILKDHESLEIGVELLHRLKEILGL